MMHGITLYPEPSAPDFSEVVDYVHSNVERSLSKRTQSSSGNQKAKAAHEVDLTYDAWDNALSRTIRA